MRATNNLHRYCSKSCSAVKGIPQLLRKLFASEKMADDPFAFIDETIPMSSSQELILNKYSSHMKVQSQSSDENDMSINHIQKHSGDLPTGMVSLPDSMPPGHKLKTSKDHQTSCVGNNVAASGHVVDVSVPFLLSPNHDPALQAAERKLSLRSGQSGTKIMASKKRRHRGPVKLNHSVSPPDSGIGEAGDKHVDRVTEVQTDIQRTVNVEGKQLKKSLGGGIGAMNVEHGSKAETNIKGTMNDEGKELLKSLDEENCHMNVEHGSRVDILDIQTNQTPLAELVKLDEKGAQVVNINNLMDVIRMYPCEPDPSFEGVDLLDVLKAKGIVLPRPRWWREGYGLEVFENEK